MSEVGIGIIGSGFMGRTYAETISKCGGRSRLRAVAVGSRAEELAKDYGIACEHSIDGLLARDDVDAVLIATPHHVHYDHAMASARAGKHMLLEKPMACSVAQCDEIIEAYEQTGVYCSIAFTQRSRDCNIKAKQLIDEGAIGRIVQMQEFALASLGLGGLPAWQSHPENLGTLFGHAIHNIDRIRWLTGREIRTVYARSKSTEPGVEVEGTSMVLMSLDDDTPVSLWASYQLPKPSIPRTQFSAWIVGERGILDLDAYGDLRVTKNGEWEVATTQAPIDWQGKGFLDPVRLQSYTRQCQDFIDAIVEKRPPAVTGWDGRQAVAAALAAYESSNTHAEIMLD